MTDSDGRPTGRKRFRADTYWILLPGLYEAARVTRVLGEAWRSADEARVKRFFQRHRTLSGWLRDPAVEQAEADAREGVRQSDPEAYERLWEEQVGRRSDDYGRWVESLKGGDLE